MFLADYHLHTYISQDGHETMPDMAGAAAKAGMSQICVTDHCDMVGWRDGKPTDRDRAVIAAVISDWEDMMKNAPPPITVRRGIELGEAHLFPEQAVKFAALPGLDFVIGSLHILREEGDFYAIPYKSNEQCYALFDKYLDQSMGPVTGAVAKSVFAALKKSGTEFYINPKTFRESRAADIIIISVMLVISGGAWLLMSSSGLNFGSVGTSQYYLEVVQNTDVLYEIPMTAYGTYEVKNSSTDGDNIFVIDSDGAHMESASCPDKICINEGTIKAGDVVPVTCLPNKLTMRDRYRRRRLRVFSRSAPRTWWWPEANLSATPR